MHTWVNYRVNTKCKIVKQFVDLVTVYLHRINQNSERLHANIEDYTLTSINGNSPPCWDLIKLLNLRVIILTLIWTYCVPHTKSIHSVSIISWYHLREIQRNALINSLWIHINYVHDLFYEIASSIRCIVHPCMHFLTLIKQTPVSCTCLYVEFFAIF